MEERPTETTIYSLADAVPFPVERREDQRHLTLYRVGTIEVDGSIELCLIRNISAGGMMIRPYCPLRTGAHVQVEMKHGEPMEAVVSWVRDDLAGLAFAEPVDVVSLLTATMEGPRPRMPRIETRCMASVRAGARIFGLLAHDISQGGLKVAGNRGLRVGTEVVVTLPGMAPQHGVIRWDDGDCYGIAFSRLLPLSLLIDWLNAQKDSFKRAS